MRIKSCTKINTYCAKTCQVASVVPMSTMRTGRSSQREFVLKNKNKGIKLKIKPPGLQNNLALIANRAKASYVIQGQSLNIDCMGA